MANAAPDNRQVAIQLNCIGPSVLTVVKYGFFFCPNTSAAMADEHSGAEDAVYPSSSPGCDPASLRVVEEACADETFAEMRSTVEWLREQNCCRLIWLAPLVLLLRGLDAARSRHTRSAWSLSTFFTPVAESEIPAHLSRRSGSFFKFPAVECTLIKHRVGPCYPLLIFKA